MATLNERVFVRAEPDGTLSLECDVCRASWEQGQAPHGLPSVADLAAAVHHHYEQVHPGEGPFADRRDPTDVDLDSPERQAFEQGGLSGWMRDTRGDC